MTNSTPPTSTPRLQPLADIVEGKTVAVVGNAMSLLHKQESQANLIDSHDHVLRMNAGVPGVLPPLHVGSRTTIWATAKHFGELDPKPQIAVFMKLTKLGNKHWQMFEQNRRPYPMIRWTHDLEAEVKEFVGADPGTGIRMLYFLKRYTKVAKVMTFGMDCWNSLSSWSCKPNTPNHVPDLERQAMIRLMRE